ncbi:hypothetical protein ID866_5237 [Astraeus odoratus]|nr:hypothetical protein ID866_5237 [Astraeus odoratus]
MSTFLLSAQNAAHVSMPREETYHDFYPSFDPMYRSARSNTGKLYVLSYSPSHGKEDTPIRVTFTCNDDIGLDVRIRLVVGTLRVTTNVDQSEHAGSESWQLDAAAPPFVKAKWISSMVPLTIEAVNQDGRILDWVRFGDFTYENAGDLQSWINFCVPSHECSVMAVLEESSARQGLLAYAPSSGHPSSSSLRLITALSSPDRTSKRRSPHSVPPTPVSDSEYGSSSSQPRSRRPTGLPLPQSSTAGLRRTRQTAEQNEQNTQSAVLDIMTPLDSFCYDWDESELQAGRRLVRFQRMQDRNSLMITAERISQAQYDSNDIVISCIYREETNSFCVTSVDIIHLLQRLVDAEFEVDEKNRIRRNLEGLRPTTVSKSRPGFESFFQRIMDFPDPKPRKIEKDLKVFDWKLLPQALEKIISKYVSSSLYTSSSPAGFLSREGGCGPLPGDPSNCHQNASPGSSKDEPVEYFPPYGDGSAFSIAVLDAQLEAAQLMHISPVMQPSPFPAAELNYTGPQRTQDGNRLYPVQEEPSSSVYANPVILRKYSNGDAVYSIHPPQSSVSSTATSHHPSFLQDERIHDGRVSDHFYDHQQNYPGEDAVLGIPITGPSPFGPETMREDGHITSGNHVPTPTSPHTPMHGHPSAYYSISSRPHTPSYVFSHFDSHELFDLYASPNHCTNAYDASEFQAGKVHNMNTNSGMNMNSMNAAKLAGQVAF